MFLGSLYMFSVLAFGLATLDDFDEEDDFGEHVDFDFLRLCFFGILGRSKDGRSLSVPSAGRLPIASPKSWEDHVDRAEPELPMEVVAKSGAVLNSFIQDGALPDDPSQPIWATCLTSVGYPISISRSFITKIWEMNLKPLKTPLILVPMAEDTTKRETWKIPCRKRSNTRKNDKNQTNATPLPFTQREFDIEALSFLWVSYSTYLFIFLQNFIRIGMEINPTDEIRRVEANQEKSEKILETPLLKVG